VITHQSNLVCPGFPSLVLAAVCNRIYCTGFTPTVSGIPPSTRKEKSRTGMVVGISVSAGVVCLTLIFAVVYIMRKKDSEDEEGKIITIMIQLVLVIVYPIQALLIPILTAALLKPSSL